jgi:hypothetical protein
MFFMNISRVKGKFKSHFDSHVSGKYPLVGEVSEVVEKMTFQFQFVILTNSIKLFFALQIPVVSNNHLPPHINTQHRTPKSISQSTFLIFYPFLPLMGSWPKLRAIRIISIMQIPLALAVISSVNRFPIRITVICSASMS